MSIEIKAIKGPLQGRQITVDKYTILSVGRSPQSSFWLSEDSQISRTHCLFEVLPPCSCLLKDNNSNNGTFVGRSACKDKVLFERISEIFLQSGDYIKVGKDNVFSIVWPQSKAKAKCVKCKATVHEQKASAYGNDFLCVKCSDKEEIPAGSRLANWQIVGKLGHGRLGKTYLAAHLTGEKLCAIKIFRPHTKVDKTRVLKFVSKINKLRKIQHSHLVAYQSIDYALDGFFYLPCEYLEEGDLKNFIQKRKAPLTLPEAKIPIMQMLRGLEHLHHHKILHGNVKPSNLLLQKQQKGLSLKLSDYKLSRDYCRMGFKSLSKGHFVIADLRYTAPEVLLTPQEIDERADLYSAAATIYYLLTGCHIFEDASDGDLLKKTLRARATPIQQVNPNIPHPIASVIMKCLSRSPQKRYQTAIKLRKQLQKLLFPSH